MLKRLRQSLQIEESYLPETCPFLCKCPTVLSVGSAVELRATPVAGPSKEFLIAFMVASFGGCKLPLHSPSSTGTSIDGDDSNSDGGRSSSGCNSDSDGDVVNTTGKGAATIALQLKPKLNCGSIVCSAGQLTSPKIEESIIRLPSNPFMINRSFSLIFLVQQDCYQIIINGDHVMDFCHRVRAESVTHLLLDGDAIFESLSVYSAIAVPSSMRTTSYGYSSNRARLSASGITKKLQQLPSSSLSSSSSLSNNNTSGSNLSSSNSANSSSKSGERHAVLAAPNSQVVKGNLFEKRVKAASKTKGNDLDDSKSAAALKRPDELHQQQLKAADENKVKLVVVKEGDNNNEGDAKRASTAKPSGQSRLFVKGPNRTSAASKSTNDAAAANLLPESKALRTLRPHPHKVVPVRRSSLHAEDDNNKPSSIQVAS